MKTIAIITFAFVLVLMVAGGFKISAQGRAIQAPSFTASGELNLPSDYREWVFLGTGLGMTYGTAKRGADDPLVFDNIYVTRTAYTAFMSSGKWPEKAMFIMEGRASERHEFLANVGQAQGEAKYLEAAVKDSERFPDTTWAYFNFGGAKALRPSAKQIPKSFDCYTCHAQNTAVENTFVQFYPALIEVAKRFGTIKAAYDPMRKF